MKTRSLLFILCFLASALSGQPNIQWQKTFGGSSSDVVYDAHQTSDGGYIVVGDVYSTDGDVSGNHGLNDAWVLKLNGAGGIEWEKALGGSSFDRGNAISQTTDGGYIMIGSTRSNDGDVSGNHGNEDIWVVKLSDTGTLQWQKVYGGSEDEQGMSIQPANDGGYILTGNTQSNNGDVSGNHGGIDFWVVKLNDTGAIQWQKTFGGGELDNAVSILQTTDGGFFVFGIAGSNNGDLPSNHFGVSYWAIKLDALGAIEWQKTYGGLLIEFANAAAQTNDGGFILAGGTYSNDGDVSGNHGATDFWIVKINSTGDIQWQKALGGSASEVANAVIQANDGGFLVAGGSFSNNGDASGLHGGVDVWVLKLDSNGKILWQKMLGGSSEDTEPSIRQTADNGYIVTGYTTSSDGDLSGDHGNGDIWVVKLAAVATSIHEVQTQFLEIFPNPAGQIFTIQFPTDEPSLELSICDLSGRTLSGQTIKNGESVDISALSNGLYIVTATTPSGNVFLGKLRKL